MTIEQITAINNAMSLLSDISFAAGGTNSVEGWIEYVDTHIQALKTSKVDNHIIEHFQSLCDSWLPIVRQSAAECDSWDD